MFENWKYGSCPQSANLDDFPFEYYQRLITRQTIGHSNDNIVERLKVSLIKQLFENWKCGINPQNSNFGDLPFDYYQILITRQRIDHTNDNII